MTFDQDQNTERGIYGLLGAVAIGGCVAAFLCTGAFVLETSASQPSVGWFSAEEFSKRSDFYAGIIITGTVGGIGLGAILGSQLAAWQIARRSRQDILRSTTVAIDRRIVEAVRSEFEARGIHYKGN